MNDLVAATAALLSPDLLPLLLRFHSDSLWQKFKKGILLHFSTSRARSLLTLVQHH